MGLGLALGHHYCIRMHRWLGESGILQLGHIITALAGFILHLICLRATPLFFPLAPGHETGPFKYF